MHLSAFIFLALALTELAKFSFRRVYGGSLVGTVIKELGIAALYFVTWIAGFVLMLYWVSVAT